ncbi:MAG: DNA-protecting protein DprA [Deltaproteobacteria bacterium]|jgi:DNA processing protein|nr:DNA-protecting protein DprA [Deltaproteobacteria bacterium]MBT4525614.1 DNA-protecting protein DprA [Deltaproteobacteria bacterium]
MAIDERTTKILALWLIPGLGPRKIALLVNFFGDINQVFEASIQQLIKVDGINHQIANEIKTILTSKQLQQELSLIEKNQLNILGIQSDQYSTALKEIYSPPPVLYQKGSIDYQKGLFIGIVGSRKASFAGKSFCKKLIQQLASYRNDIVVVSGLALGIDTIAHQTALENNLKTIAVLAGGLSDIYPAKNRNLASQIVEKGAIITEFPVSTKPVAQNFPLRNRIISGVSSGIIVIEAGDKSGALITANYAIEQNRELFAVPGPVDSSFFVGTNRLIQKGHAKLIMDAADILEELDTSFKRSNKTAKAQTSKLIEYLTEEESLVIDRLKTGELTQNKLSEELKIPINILLGILTALELKGMITIKSGSVVQLLQF